MGEESGAAGKPYLNLAGRKLVFWGEVQNQETLGVVDKLFLEDQIVNVFGFAGPMVSVATA